MSYLALQLLPFLILVFLIGLAVGWYAIEQ